jgi:hypothetical protein
MLRADGAAIAECYVYENDSALPLGSMPPNSIELVWWEGSVIGDARKTEVSEYLWAAKPAGIQAYGNAELAGPPVGPIVVVDDQGQSHVVSHTIADDINIQVRFTIVTNSDYPGLAYTQNYISGWVTDNLGIGDSVYILRIIALFYDIPGVEEIVAVNIGVIPAWGVVNIPIGDREIAILDPANVTVI